MYHLLLSIIYCFLMTNTTPENDQKCIQQALDLLKEKHGLEINTADFYCKVWRNAHTVAVEFTRIVRYVPLGSKEADFEYDIVVNLSNNTVLPFDEQILKRDFYVPSEKDLRSLDFIKEHFGPFSTEFENTVTEEAEEYKISCTNEASYGLYSINKRTGEQGPAIQGSYTPMPGPTPEERDDFPGISD